MILELSHLINDIINILYYILSHSIPIFRWPCLGGVNPATIAQVTWPARTFASPFVAANLGLKLERLGQEGDTHEIYDE